jgi:hypothetical protein
MLTRRTIVTALVAANLAADTHGRGGRTQDVLPGTSLDFTNDETFCHHWIFLNWGCGTLPRGPADVLSRAWLWRPVPTAATARIKIDPIFWGPNLTGRARQRPRQRPSGSSTEHELRRHGAMGAAEA